MESFPPPELHLLMGVVNHVIDALLEVEGEEKVMDWCHSHNIIRRGYNGGTIDGNNCREILRNAESLAAAMSKTKTSGLIVAVLHSFEPIVSGMFSHSLTPDYRNLISNFEKQFLVTKEHLEGILI